MKEGLSTTFEKAKAIAKLGEGASQQIKSIHNSNTQTGSIDNIQRVRKTKIQHNSKIKELDTTELNFSLPSKVLEATLAMNSNKQAITMVSYMNRDHHLPKEADLQSVIMDTTTLHDRDNHKLTPVKNVVT